MASFLDLVTASLICDIAGIARGQRLRVKHSTDAHVPSPTMRLPPSPHTHMYRHSHGCPQQLPHTILRLKLHFTNTSAVNINHQTTKVWNLMPRQLLVCVFCSVICKLQKKDVLLLGVSKILESTQNKEGYYECNATRLTAREVEGMV